MRKLASLALVVLAAGAAATTVNAAPEHAVTRGKRLQQALDAVVAAGVPGAVAVVREGDRTIRLSSGYADLKRRRPIRARDRFRVGSITKSFVATVVLQLVGEGKLRLTDTVERWLPGVVPNGRRITVRQLLEHTSGLFDYGGDAKWLAAAVRDPLRDWSPREIVAVATAHKPHFRPGSGWSYANTNYYVLGLIAEAATRRPLGSELRRRIFAPLNLRATSFPTGPAIAGRHARGYFVGPLQDVTAGSPSVLWAAGALVSSGDDLSRFFRALLGGRLLRRDLLHAMEKVVPLRVGFSYGLGLQRLPTRCGASWGHTGGSPGYSVDAYNSKDGTRQVVVLVNGTDRLAQGLKNFRSFDVPERASRALERLIQTAYCH